MKQQSGSSSLSALKLKSFSSLVKWWARIIHVTWKVTCLYGIFTGCVWMHAHIPENHWQCECSKSEWSGNKCRNTLPVYFPESLCERGFRETTSVQENVVLANIKALDLCVCGCMYTHAITLTHTHIYSYKLLWELPTLSRGNSYVFYEVANLYEFVWPHSYDLVQFV